MTENPFVRDDLIKLMGAHAGLLRRPSDHAAAWFASVTGRDPLVEHVRGQRPLEGDALRRVALDTACGVVSAIESIQARLTVVRSDPRVAERREIERLAQLPKTPPLGVDSAAWSNLRASQDPARSADEREAAVRALDAYATADPAAFGRLNTAAAAHDRAVDALVERALSNEDGQVYAAAARTCWSRHFGTERPLPKLPVHVAVFALNVAFRPRVAGAILCAMGRLATPRTSELHSADAGILLRREVDRSLRFWRDRDRKSDGPPGTTAANFLVDVRDLVLSAQRSLEMLEERGGAKRSIPRRGTWTDLGETGE